MSVSKKIEQWLNVKFLIIFGKSGAKINKILSTVYGEDASKPATVYKYVKHFLKSEDIGDDVQSGYLFSSHTEENFNW